MTTGMLVRLGRLGARRGLALRREYGVGSRATGRCPSCGTVLPTALPVCARCRYIGGVGDSITHHELFGLPYEPNPFVVDTRELKRRFLEAQRLVHPDAWATRSEGDKNAALAVSNAVNRAYRTLLSPMERIGYVLWRHGKEVREEDQVEDMGLIAEVIEAREAIERSDGAGLSRLREENEAKTTATTGEIERAVGRADWTRARSMAVRLKYLAGIGDAIGRAENAE